VASAVARRMVVPPHRDGGQSSSRPAPCPTSTTPRGCTRRWCGRRTTCRPT
jgi:hypothetical protein